MGGEAAVSLAQRSSGDDGELPDRDTVNYVDFAPSFGAFFIMDHGINGGKITKKYGYDESSKQKYERHKATNTH